MFSLARLAFIFVMLMLSFFFALAGGSPQVQKANRQEFKGASGSPAVSVSLDSPKNRVGGNGQAKPDKSLVMGRKQCLASSLPELFVF